MPEEPTGWTYADVAVDYEKLDPIKRMAIELFGPTLKHTERLGIQLLPTSSGLTAVAFDMPTRRNGRRLAFNVEGLGTKNKAADEIYAKLGVADETGKWKRGYRCVGQCTAAMSVNDLVGIGADPFLYGDILAVGQDKWFEDLDRARALLEGFRDAADLGQFAIPLGETPALKGIIYPETADLAGASVGVIDPPERFMDGSKIRDGDVIFGISTPGPNANGMSKLRKIAASLPDGYFTKMDETTDFGDGFLTPTPIYARPIMEMFEAGVDIHALQPITGHGWSKIARFKADYTYNIKDVPKPPLIFQKAIEWGGSMGADVRPEENYFVWNMGVGFVVIAPQEYESAIIACSRRHGLDTYRLGGVKKGDRKVVMEPFGFAYNPR